MLKAIKNIFRSSDLIGASLTKPLISYRYAQNNYTRNIVGPLNSQITRCVLRIANFIESLFLYTFFGGLATIGMPLKLLDVSRTYFHNARVKNEAEAICNNLQHAELKANPNFALSLLPNSTFVITEKNKQAQLEAIQSRIDDVTSAYYKVYLTEKHVPNPSWFAWPGSKCVQIELNCAS